MLGDKFVKELMTRKGYLEKLIRKTEKEISSIEKKNKAIQDLGIRAVKHGKGFQYYLTEKGLASEGKYIKKKDLAIARAIAQLQYDNKIVKTAGEELLFLHNYLERKNPLSLSQTYTGLPKGRQQLINPIELPDEEYIARWKQKEYQNKKFEENAPEFYTNLGERVRSKSEVMIANALEKYKIPYHYEYPWQIHGLGLVNPDFTILRIGDRKEFVWEHLGLMDSQDYVSKNLYKLNCYEMSGLALHDNLILTYENSLHPLNTRLIEKKIQEILII